MAIPNGMGGAGRLVDDRYSSVAMYRGCWTQPERTLWVPLLAAAGLSLMDSAGFPLEQLPFGDGGPLLFDYRNQRLGTEFTTAERVAVSQFSMCGVGLAVQELPDEDLLVDLGLLPPLASRGRLDAEGSEVEVARHAAWVALVLASQVPRRSQIRDFLQGRKAYHSLGYRFAQLAREQGIRTWEEAFASGIDFWEGPTGELLLRILDVTGPHRRREASQEPKPPEPPRVEALPAVNHPAGKLDAKLAKARDEAAEAKAFATVWQAEVAKLKVQVVELRQARDRAAARVRGLEARLAAGGTAVHGGGAGRTGGPADVRSVPPTAPALSASPVATPAPATSPAPAASALFAGRQVYLYTGLERAAARREMAAALEQYGAFCQVMDGNRPGESGPERFDRDALVVVDTRKLSHSASRRIAERARASGAWLFLGAVSQGSVARRVAERWGRGRG